MTDKPRDAGGAVALLACPFCGGEPDGTRCEENEMGYCYFVISCSGGCGCFIEEETETGVIAAWNRRAPSALLDECAALEKACRNESMLDDERRHIIDPDAMEIIEARCGVYAVVADELAALIARHGETK